jgi:2-methylcitrate dehydratase
MGGQIDLAALEPLVEGASPIAILGTSIKRWPVEYHAQSAVEAALEIRSELGEPSPERIASVRIETFDAAYQIIAADPQKRDPRTRETADHSLQYIVAAALLDGEVSPRTFDESRFRDPATLALLRDAVVVEEDPVLSKEYPEAIPNRITVRMRDGAEVRREVALPLGHARRPMTDADLSAKFRANVAGRWTPERAAPVERLVEALPLAPTIDALAESLESST